MSTPNILAIDPGAASTKFALFMDDRPLFVRHLRHSPNELAGPTVLSQLASRLRCIDDELNASGLALDSLLAVAGRGGLLHPLTGGTYRVNQAMLDELRLAPRGEHAANLGAFLAHAIATRLGIEAYIVDPVSVDEWCEVARLSGCALLERPCLSHALNSRAVARRFARQQVVAYEDLRLVVAHLGSGFSISAHSSGRMIDATNPREEGAFGADRAGSVPASELVRLCFSGRYTEREVAAMLTRRGGLLSYLGTSDLAEVEQRITEGDEEAALVFDAMIYQIAKEIGAMACVLHGQVDAILLTGGMAHSARLVSAFSRSIRWIAPIHIFPGEDELQALAEGVLRVLHHQEPLREFTARPVAR